VAPQNKEKTVTNSILLWKLLIQDKKLNVSLFHGSEMKNFADKIPECKALLWKIKIAINTFCICRIYSG
jgi:hypothetical protein